MRILPLDYKDLLNFNKVVFNFSLVKKQSLTLKYCFDLSLFTQLSLNKKTRPQTSKSYSMKM